MKRDLKINFFMLDEISLEINKYKAALDDMEKSASNMLRMLRQNKSMAIKELEDKYYSFIAELKKCYSELDDMYKILTSYSEEMQAIIRPINRTAFMRVDRNDIYMNMRTIISAKSSVATLAYNRGNIGIFNLASFTKSGDEKQREEENYRKMERIWQEVIPRYARKLETQVDELNRIYKKKIIPFENKDDEFKSKAKKMGEKYTNNWETIRKAFQNAFVNTEALLKGFGIAISDTVVGIYELAKGIVFYAAAAVVLVELRTNDEFPKLKEDKREVIIRKWAEDTFNGTNNTIATILNDPSLIVEGLSQGISDAYEEEGIFYCGGYVIGSIIGAKGIDKLAKVGKISKVKLVKGSERLLDSPVDELLSKTGGTGIGAEAAVEAKIANELSTGVLNKAKYVEQEVTKTMKSLEIDGAHLEGLDYRLKGNESLCRKILSDSHVKGITLEEAASDIGDSLRYTLVTDEANYTQLVKQTLKQLEEKGYKINKVKNFWGEEIYQGINVSLTTSHGVKMELQFHTGASFYTKEVLNHKYYEIARSETASIKEITEANKIMIENQSKVTIPDGSENILGLKGEQ